jgi:hypothetical protein
VKVLTTNIVNIQHANTRYWTTFVEDRKEGFVGLRLHQESFGKTSDAAKVIFWDASGGFTVKTINGDVPVEIIEALIEETKATIKIA